MLIKTSPQWQISESNATPEKVFWNRREFSKRVAAGLISTTSGVGLAAGLTISQSCAAKDSLGELLPAPLNKRYKVTRPITPKHLATTYNNFIEFGAHKDIWKSAMQLPLRPWEIRLDGLVETPVTLDFDDVVRKMSLEERLLRHRCVEAWSMTVPWTGFPLHRLIDIAKPLQKARYLKMSGFEMPDIAHGQRQTWLPWPYVEGITLAEAANELAMIVVGAYGEPLPHQNGAPLRLVLPWKYGFKSSKSIQRFTFTEHRPISFWEQIAGNEYGFWANVNPQVPHPRWSQSTEQVLGTKERIPTQIYNGYGDFVAHLYDGLQNENLFV